MYIITFKFSDLYKRFLNPDDGKYTYMGNNNYGSTETFYYGIVKNDVQELTHTIYNCISKYSTAKLQWDLKRLLGTEKER